MSFRLLNQRPVYFGNDGKPCAGGSLAFYESGTLTPTDTWADPALTVSNGTSVTLDSAGRTEVDVWATGIIRVILRDANGFIVADSDDAQPNGGIPDQTGKDGDFLTTTAGNLSWTSISQVPSTAGVPDNYVLSVVDGVYGWNPQTASVDNTTITGALLVNVDDNVQVITAAATKSIDCRAGAIIVFNQAVDSVVTFTNLPAAGRGKVITFIRVKDATATSRALSFAGTTDWPNGVPITWTQTTGAIDVVALLVYNGVVVPLASYNNNLS